MPVFSDRKVMGALTKKGFVEAKTHSSKHVFYEFMNEDGKKTGINTHFSKNGQEIGDSLISAMSKQMKISRKEFIDFVRCTLSKDEYAKIIRQKGYDI